MRNSINSYTTKDWVRLAAKVSLLFTEPKVRKAVGDRIKDGMDDITDSVTSKYEDVHDTVASKYEEAVERMNSAKAALRGRNPWPARATGFLLGVGVGAGLGILLAPASGAETRDVVHNKAVDIKNKVFGSAAAVTEAVTEKIRGSVTNMPFTGTEA